MRVFFSGHSRAKKTLRRPALNVDSIMGDKHSKKGGSRFDVCCSLFTTMFVDVYNFMVLEAFAERL